ncbi:MAG: type III pantothenate kinase [bacterium]
MNPMNHFFVIDVGNTSTHVGVVKGRRILKQGRMPTRDGRDERNITALLRRVAGKRVVSDAVLCSVVPGLNPLWSQVITKLCGASPMVVDHTIRLNFTVDYPRPETIGADRLADAAAAWDRYKGAVIVADFGTALTFDVITGDGRYTGGVIAPGLPLMTDYLAERTALLPQIRLSNRFSAVGRSTDEAMRIGAMVGYRGMVREILGHIRAGMKERRVRFCATGGYAGLALKGLETPVEILPELTLEGLVRIRELNRPD